MESQYKSAFLSLETSDQTFAYLIGWQVLRLQEPALSQFTERVMAATRVGPYSAEVCQLMADRLRDLADKNRVELEIETIYEQ